MNKEINPNLDQNLNDLKELANEILYIENQIKQLNKSKKELANEFLNIFKNNIIYNIDDEILECLDLLENGNLGGKNDKYIKTK